MVRADNSGVQLIPDIYAEKRAAGRPVISIEFFPPKTPKGDESLFTRTLPRLAAAHPDFCSVTYGAGGSTRAKTLQVVDRIQRAHGLPGMAHLTCIGSTRAQIDDYLREAAALGIHNILALRGDPPRDDADFVQPQNGLDYSFQLIDVIKAHGPFAVGAAGFPESHVACAEGKHVDWQRVGNKIAHGAEFILTQLFFTNADYFEFVDYMTNVLQVTAPITPGILPILSSAQITRFTALCGATLPAHLSAKLDALGDDTEAVTEFGVEFASRQCEELLRGGAPGLHFYSLNRSRSSLAILKNLGLA